MNTSTKARDTLTAVDRERILNMLRKHLNVLETRFGVLSLALFGSTARDERRTDSDVDLLVDFGDPPTFRQYTGTLLYLEDLLGCKVDLATQGTLNPHIAEGVERDLLTIHAA